VTPGKIKMQFLIATTNPGKVREFRHMLCTDRFQWIGLADLPPTELIEETGHTFRANAILKAAGYAKLTGLWTMADDSGLEVDALKKKPGIHSARWAQLHHTGTGDAANNALLLDQMKDIPADRRTGRFVCVLAVANPQGQIILTTRATMEGNLRFTPAGENGFGYDPLFQVQGLQKTSAELPSEQKHRISHRGQALERMKQLMRAL
jgi:XTP/dITP diphosphohydrolase